MPAHHLEGYAQTGKKVMKEHELAQSKSLEGNESESESEDEDSGDESDE